MFYSKSCRLYSSPGYDLHLSGETVRMLMGGSRGGTGGPDPPLKNHNIIGFPSNTGPDPLKNHKVTKPAFNVGPSTVRQ